MRVKCLVREHNAMTLARARTTQSTNSRALTTIPPIIERKSVAKAYNATIKQADIVQELIKWSSCLGGGGRGLCKSFGCGCVAPVLDHDLIRLGTRNPLPYPRLAIFYADT